MPKNQQITLFESISMAVGTMIGASIFSIFGVGARIAQHNLPEAFVLSGLFALLVAYSYAKLGSEIVSNAGPIAFIISGIGDNIMTGTLSVLMWLSYVVSIALFLKGFAGYFLPLCHIHKTPLATGLVETGLVAFFIVLNLFGGKTVGRAELYVVIGKLTILGIFIIGGFFSIKSSLIKPSFDPPHIKGTVNAAVIFFLSYMGFGLVTNASENMLNPRRNVPRAIYASIAVVMFVYVSVALVAVGNLSIADLMKYQENALAVAARPFLGHFGFLLISIGALLSISSALNATLYGGANIAYSLAKDGELPEFFERKIWFKSTEGLYITGGLGLFFALLFNIGEIASITSVIFTVIYIFVIVSHYRLSDRYGGNKIFIAGSGVTLTAVVTMILIYQWQTQKMAFWGSIITFLTALIIEYIYRLATKRGFKKQEMGTNGDSH